MAGQCPAAAPPAAPVAAPRSIIFRSNKADTPWQHEYVRGTTIGTTICTTTNMMVKMVNNFLDHVCSKCEDLAIYHTQIICIMTADGDRHNMLVDYNDIKLSNMCQTVRNLHEVKEDRTETVVV
jgi:predicted RNA-binding Zn-ribbon protein involved in translation (DUF1610 family)